MDKKDTSITHFYDEPQIRKYWTKERTRKLNKHKTTYFGAGYCRARANYQVNPQAFFSSRLISEAIFNACLTMSETVQVSNSFCDFSELGSKFLGF
jgi:hypothetical protein